MSDSSCKYVLPSSCMQSFPPVFLCFSENLLGCMNFRRFCCDTLHMGFLSNFPVFMSKPFRTRQKFLNFVFVKWSFLFAGEFCFGVDSKTCQFDF